MVKAVETSLRELLEGAKQYQVPLYQRTYSWKGAQLQRLWEDLVQLAEDRSAHGSQITHFLGSLVLAPTPDIGPAGVSRYLVVDGQQRLTTTTLLLAAIRDHRAETESPEHRDRLNEQYLVNKWKSGDDRLKLLPTQADRPSYVACIESSRRAGTSDQIGEAYRYFRGRLADHDDPDDEHDIERLEDAVLSGLTLVSVTTTRDDNAHRIFESLNNTGLKLTQGDLLRNYLFMRLPTRGPVVYETQWLPLQQRLSDDELELLFWLDAVQRDDSITQRETYQAQVNRMDSLVGEEVVEAEVRRFNDLSGLLGLILNPADEADVAVRERLLRLKSWRTTTAYPLLLHLLDRRARGAASSDEIVNAMRYLESFLVRRLVIGRATTGLNRVLLRSVPEVAGKEPVDAAVRTYLSTGRKFFATDAQVRAGVTSTAFYFSGRSPQRKQVLAWIEETYASKERVDPASCSIEHVLPQTLTPTWREMLGSGLDADESVADAYDALVHTLGNLTLTGYNSELGNKSFAAKRAEYTKSGLRMNHEIAQRETWGRAQIEHRAAELAERIIREWPGPDETVQQEPVRAAWGLMNRALAELPNGAWTSYSAVAQLIGSHQVPVGQRIANHPVPNGHRVLQAAGTVSPGFRWLADSGRSESQREALEVEGVTFDDAGHADPAQFFDAEDLAALAGVDLSDDEARRAYQDDGGHDRSFWAQLDEARGSETMVAVGELAQAWTRLGGRIEYGSAAATSCFLVTDGPAGDIWPATLYPSGKFEVVFQYLASRPPFDDIAMREALRLRFNEVPGVELPASKVGLRPGFPLELLADGAVLQAVEDVLMWFVGQLDGREPPAPRPLEASASNDWYVSFGEGGDRAWVDALRFGFVSAGGGKWYSSTLRGIPVGARIFVHIADHGYVGVGETLGPARRFDQAEVLVDQAWTRLAGLGLQASYQHVADPADVTDDNAEYVVPVRWFRAVDLPDGFWEGGMFANQHSACRLTQRFTIGRLAKHFGLT